jgi:hypothetical protein
LTTWLSEFSARAEMPYPPNPQPCADDGAGDCIEATSYADYLFLPVDDPPVLPNDFGSDNWKLTSETTGEPEIDDSAQELFGVKGASVDLAWQTTTGRPDVLIAVLDSGIRWQDPLVDLVSKFYLNRGELPVPEGADNPVDSYDRNADGVFNILDYLQDDANPQDSRVEDRNGNGIVDPEDLIFIFSDGVDDDANGYIDDISGWDFYEDDNDPLDEVRYGHGTGESNDSGAEANNGTGGVGTCPNCMLLEVRVGDSFVAEVNAFAQGVAFAVDSGADVIQEALGALNQTRFGQEAIDYAYRRGVVVIASAADEESNHHNYPANYARTVQVNSVRRFENLVGIEQSPRSYLYLNGCTNYGGHIAMAVPSSSCSSEATGNSSGMAGLVVSAALNAIEHGELDPYPRDDGSAAEFALSAEEVKQLLTLTTDDINFDARSDVEPPLPQNYNSEFIAPGVGMTERFRSTAGWDQFFGYGRVNADRAVQWAATGRIPPEASISSPDWYDIIDPEESGRLAILGRVAANRSPSYAYELAVAPGIQPAEGDFVAQNGDGGLTRAVDGNLGEIDVDALRQRMPFGVEGPAVDADGAPDPDRFTFTVRLRVTDERGLVGEDRRVFALHHDADLVAGFPIELDSDGVSSPATADLDGDGNEEIIIATSSGRVHALRADGTELPGWPVTTDPLEIHEDAVAFASGEITTPVYGSVLGAVAVGDLDRDGLLEVSAADLQGKLYVWTSTGERLPGFPVSTLPEYSHSRRSERDLSTPEGLVPDLVNRHTSANRVGRSISAGPVLGNLDGSNDGSLEIIAGAFDRHLYAWHADGTPVRGWPVLLKDPEKVAEVDPLTDEIVLREDAGERIGTKVLVPPSIGDLDGDGDLEVVAVVNEEYREEPNAVFTDPIVLIFRAAGILDMGNTRLYALHHDGAAHGATGLERGWNPEAFLPGFPVRTTLMTTELLPLVGTGSNGPPALADVDGDGQLEIATMSAVGPAYVFRNDGVSFFGRAETGEDLSLVEGPFGAASDSSDTPAFGALGAPVLGEFAGPGNGFHLLAPVSGLGKLVDNQLAARQIPADNHLAVWPITAGDGTPSDRGFAEAFPRRVNDLQFISGPALADITGDGLPEALEGSGVYDLHAFDIEGREPAGWPKFTNGWMIGSSAVGDIDGDGLLEVVAATREGKLFVWNTGGGECGNIPWRRFHHDEWGTGNYHADTRPPASLPADAVTTEVMLPSTLRLHLAAVPGDDLFCGGARIEVRSSDQPIETHDDFAAAAPATVVEAADAGRLPGVLVAEDSAWQDREVHVALATVDEAGNASAVTSLGSVSFAASSGDDDGCAVTAANRGVSGWALLPVVLIFVFSARRRLGR